MSEPGYPDSAKALSKAEDAIKNAEHNLKGGFFAVTANTAYYACYYCIVALLYTKNMYTKTHLGAKAKFAELFIKTGVFPLGTSESIAMLFEYRQAADYDLDENISQKEAEELIYKATEIYEIAKDYYQNIINNQA